MSKKLKVGSRVVFVKFLDPEQAEMWPDLVEGTLGTVFDVWDEVDAAVEWDDSSAGYADILLAAEFKVL